MRTAATAVMALISVLVSALRGGQFGHDEPDLVGLPGAGDAVSTASQAGAKRPADALRTFPMPNRPGPRARQRWVRSHRSWPPWCSPAAMALRGVPWWGVVSSAAAPVLLVAAWTVAAGLQPRSFDVVGGTVSALAADGAAYRWVMTLAFAVAGACEVVTGLALRPAASPGRLILMAGGVAGVLVAANPQHAGGSLTHAVWAVVGFSALVAWPAGAWRRGSSVPWALRPAVSASAVATLLGLLAWFGMELVVGGGQVGLAERVMGLAQAGWPLVVVLSCRLSSPACAAQPRAPAAAPGAEPPRHDRPPARHRGAR